MHGRLADLVNIAGKRSSLAYLNYQLNSIAGVLDGAFFHCDEAARCAPRRHACGRVRGRPDARAGAHHRELRRRIDPVFLPRPLLLVPQLPRNATGKLPQEALQALAAAHLKVQRGLRAKRMRATSTVTITADHPALAGPLPRCPDRSGVLLLDETLRALEQEHAPGRTRWRIGAREVPQARASGGDTPGRARDARQRLGAFLHLQCRRRGGRGTLLPASAEEDPRGEQARRGALPERPASTQWVEIPERAAPPR